MNDHLTSQPVAPASISASPEFVDSKGLRAIFGISRSHGYALADAGLVKTVCLRRPGAVKGKRLWCAKDLRDFLMANLDQRKSDNVGDQRKKQEPAAPKVKESRRDPALAALEAERNELRKELAKIGVVT